MRICSDRARALVQAIAAVPGLDGCIGCEAQVRAGLHQLVDDCLIAHRIDVVHGEGALVANVSKVLEFHRSLHTARSSAKDNATFIMRDIQADTQAQHTADTAEER